MYRVECRAYTPEYKSADDTSRAGKTEMFFAAGNFSMNVMVPDKGDPKHGGQLVWIAGSPPISDPRAALEQWHKHITISVARATYCKKEEALVRDPDARMLNFVDNIESAESIVLCDLELGLEAVVCLQVLSHFVDA